ncbi:MAG: S-layer homology domain-containing protein, partial [Firmicutes bacterium]|nr:S-layer homology domain-containing protein [Bacillota bacterium]
MLLISLMPVQVFAVETFKTSESVMELVIGEKISKNEVSIAQNGVWVDMDLEGSLPAGLDWAYGEGQDPYLYGTPTGPRGTYQVLFVGRSSESSVRYSHKLTIKVKEPPKTVRTDYSFDLYVGETYSSDDLTLNVDTSAYDYGWTSMDMTGSLPPGMDWRYGEASDPSIYGTPTGPEKTYNAYFTGKIYDSDDTFLIAVALYVREPKTIKTSETFYLTKGEECDLYTDIDFIGDDKAWEDVTVDAELPDGLLWVYNAYLAPDIYGTPTETGRFDITFTCTPRDSKNVYEHKVVLVVNESEKEPEPAPIETSQTGEALIGEEGAFLLAEEMGVDFNLDKLVDCEVWGTLPPGMTWNFHETQGPYLYGTPTEPGTYKMIFKLKTASGKSYWHHLTVTTVEKPQPAEEKIYYTGSEKELEVYAGEEFSYNIDVDLGVSESNPIDSVEWTRLKGLQMNWDSVKMPTVYGTLEEPGAYKTDIKIWQKNDCHIHTLTIFDGNKPAEKPEDLPPRPGIGLQNLTTPFTDVSKNDYFYTAVVWAYNADPQITDGNGKDKFMPEQFCTRGQVVTFLWRAAGCPEPKSSKNPFTDVKQSD